MWSHWHATSLRHLLFLSVAVGYSLAAGCSRPDAPVMAGHTDRSLAPTSPPTSLPPPPFDLSAPPAEPSVYGDQDLRGLSPGALAYLANRARERRNWVAYVRLEYWAIAAGGGNQYNLACAYALNGQVDEAIYWLQRAGAEDGADAEHAERDPDLVRVRGDRRWPALSRYLRKCNAFWRASGVHDEIVILPESFEDGASIPILIGLHGKGTSASEFASPYYQQLANELNVAFLLVSGPEPTSAVSFNWSEDQQRNAERVEQALELVADRIDAAGSERILFGFSQGATAAIEIAARHPDRYAGAIALSAGAYELPERDRLTRAKKHGQQTYVLVCGDAEHPMTIKTTRVYADIVRELGASVTHKEYPGMNQHTFPPDFHQQMPIWIASILDAQSVE